MRKYAEAHIYDSEDVIQVAGHVGRALPGTENHKLPTGDIELVAEAAHPESRRALPFPLDEELSNEDLRLHLPLFRSAPSAACAAIFGFVIASPKRRVITSTSRVSSKWKHRFSRRAHRKARAISSCRADSRRENFMRCRRRRSNTSSCSWSAEWKNISRSRNVSATKICAPIDSRNSPRSISKRHSSRRITSSRSPKECSPRSSKRRAGHRHHDTVRAH